MKKLLLAALLLTGAHPTSWAQGFPPEPVDLQAGYCFGLAKLSLPSSKGTSTMPGLSEADRARAVAWRANLEANFNRLRGYVIGRMSIIDMDGVLIASKQAELDLNAGLAAIESCVKTCSTPACAGTCQVPAAISNKFKRCDDLSFLPY